ncbi:hypothetical protein K2173_027648 [Erythroxylum novogranatense]|uniref:U6 snRNA phosphodiesterase n=1 Tax=Erythroxylum novogranatense TaxID=1862640 RepID=A0AAV8U0Z3_9ROSI|nr:hypothetical protein K2173_027648 [Erythroxylum novogranatense]
MEALIASYPDDSSDSDSDTSQQPPPSAVETKTLALPPPPISLLTPPNSTGFVDHLETGQPGRVRSFPHVQGNYALHVYIPVYIPPQAKKEVAILLKKVSSLVTDLRVVDADIPLNDLCRDDKKLEQVVLGKEFHISLGRTVPIRVHQIDSVVTMLRQKLQSQKRYWIDFSKWEVFVNDDQTRSFLSIEVVNGGLDEIVKQIRYVNEVYRLHNLPEFYKDPRPHISLAWALGDIGDSLKRVVEEELQKSSKGASVQKRVFACKFSGIECKIGQKLHKICKIIDE